MPINFHWVILLAQKLGMDDPPPSRIQFHEGIHPARPVGSFMKELKEVSNHDFDQEERARKIAHDDLGLKRKQVRKGVNILP